jgi:hypothetical protein
MEQVTQDLIESINDARSIIEDLDQSAAMTLGFEENEMYNLSGKDLLVIAKALYLSDCFIYDNINEGQ